MAAAATLAAAHRDPGYAVSAGYGAGTAALIVAGSACAAAGLGAWQRRSSSAFGALVAAAGLCWFLPAWNSPAAGSSIGFTVGLVGVALSPPLVAHAVLVFPAGRLARPARGAVVALYATDALLLGLAPTLLFDPSATGCTDCPRNLLRLADAPVPAAQVSRFGTALAAGLCVLLCGLAARRLFRMSPALRRAAAPTTAFAVLFLAASAAGYEHLLSRSSLALDQVDRRWWFVQCAALLGLAGAVVAGWSSARRTRGRVARLVVDLAHRPPPGGLRDLLARTLADDSLVLAYVLSDGSHVDVTGRRVTLGVASTALIRGGADVAVLSHRPGLLDDPTTVEEVVRAAGLVLDNERLQAELSSQLQRLRASRQRIVAAGDAARRRLERNVHDGAQQRLVAVLLELRLAHARSAATHDERCAAAEKELVAAVEELRAIALGIFPAVLADEGLAEAVDAFAEGAEVPVQVVDLPSGRLPEPVESAAYFVVSEAVQRSAACRARVSVRQQPDLLHVDVDLTGGGASAGWLQGLKDRIGAVDGEVTCSAVDGQLQLRVEIPCVS